MAEPLPIVRRLLFRTGFVLLILLAAYITLHGAWLRWDEIGPRTPTWLRLWTMSNIGQDILDVIGLGFVLVIGPGWGVKRRRKPPSRPA
jgi:hypothetical protein